MFQVTGCSSFDACRLVSSSYCFEKTGHRPELVFLARTLPSMEVHWQSRRGVRWRNRLVVWSKTRTGRKGPNLLLVWQTEPNRTDHFNNIYYSTPDHPSLLSSKTILNQTACTISTKLNQPTFPTHGFKLPSLYVRTVTIMATTKLEATQFDGSRLEV